MMLFGLPTGMEMKRKKCVRYHLLFICANNALKTIVYPPYLSNQKQLETWNFPDIF